MDIIKKEHANPHIQGMMMMMIYIYLKKIIINLTIKNVHDLYNSTSSNIT